MNNGERRHETCRHGRLTEAWCVEMVGKKTPTVIPLCGWRVPEPCPPAVKRAWGGNAIDTEDCAACQAYDPL